MKFIVLRCMLLLTITNSYAQKEVPEFGDFSGKELALKQCDFDKEADAIILFDVAYSGYNDQHNLITNRRIRFKILKQKGIGRADISIPYYSKEDFESISNVKAITYTRVDNGEILPKELDKKAVFRQKLNERVSVLKFTLPNVKVGSIIDYSYELFAQNYGGLDDWYFQTDMPTLLSSYTLNMIPNGEFTYVIHKAKDMPIKVNSDSRGGTMSFEMSNIAGLRYEPFMDASKDYLQYVEFQLAGYLDQLGSKVKYMTTWKESAQELLSSPSFGKQLGKNLANSEQIIAKANTLAAPFDKMKFIYEYVKTNFNWNDVDTKFADDGIKNVWANKTGTSGEINLVLINLLKQAGLQVDPMLVSARDHGKVSTEFPIIDQFNKVVAYTVIDDKKFILDATSVNTPVDVIPFNLLNTNAFIVNYKKPVVIRLTGSKALSNYINISSDITNDGVINGYASINSYDYARISRLEEYTENKVKFQNDYFQKDNPEIKIDSFETINAGIDSLPLRQEFKFFMPCTVSGDYKLVKLNLFSGLEKNPFTLENRFTDINFGCTHRTDINEVFELPSNLKPEQIPKNVQIITPDKSISFIRMATLDSNTVIIQISLKINETLYTADDYPMLKEFYKKMYNLLNEQIVLSNK